MASCNINLAYCSSKKAHVPWCFLKMQIMCPCSTCIRVHASKGLPPLDSMTTKKQRCKCFKHACSHGKNDRSAQTHRRARIAYTHAGTRGAWKKVHQRITSHHITRVSHHQNIAQYRCGTHHSERLLRRCSRRCRHMGQDDIQQWLHAGGLGGLTPGR